MLAVQDVHTYYGDSYVLQGVSLRVAPASIAAVLGRNGVGKSTLIRTVMGFNPPRRGTITFGGRDITTRSADERARAGIGLVPQGRRIFASLSVRENLDIAARPRAERPESGWSLNDIWRLFPRLHARRAVSGTRLSGGEQQMLATGRALMGNHRCLLMDEPTEGLSPLLVKHLRELVADFRRQGLAVLLVEQNLSFALKVADYVYVMNKGTIVFEGEPETFRGDRDIQARFLGLGERAPHSAADTPAPAR